VRTSVFVLDGEPDRTNVAVLKREDMAYNKSDKIYPIYNMLISEFERGYDRCLQPLGDLGQRKKLAGHGQSPPP
jgi:hypothetical protein